MADLKMTIRWQKYIPDLGTNRGLSTPFFVELATDITRVQMKQLTSGTETSLKRADFDSDEAYADAELRRLEQVLAPFVRLGTEPLVVDDKPVLTLFDLLKVYSQLATGPFALSELPATVRYLNSPVWNMEQMYSRLAGGLIPVPPKNRTGRG